MDKNLEYVSKAKKYQDEGYWELAAQQLEFAGEYRDSILVRASRINPQNIAFLGWKVTHKYRSKTKDGVLDIKTSNFIIDKSFHEVLFSTTDEKYNRSKQFLFSIFDNTDQDYWCCWQ